MNGATAANESAMPPRPLVVLAVDQIKGAGLHDLLKLTWRTQDGKAFRPYCVDLQNVLALSKVVRERLDELVGESLNAVRSGPGTARRLLQLVNAGRALGNEIFTPTEDSPYANEAPKVLGWLAGQNPPPRVHVEVSSNLYVPWALVFDPSAALPDVATAAKGPSAFESLWCLKHLVSATYGAMDPTRAESDIPQAELRILPVVNKSLLESAAIAKSRDGADLLTAFEQATLDCLCEFQPVHDLAGFATRWAEIDGRYGVIHITGHADGARLALNENEMLTELNFLEMGRGSRTAGGGVLAFLNGCLTGTGSGSEIGGFLKVVRGTGFFGFIGTESPVPDLFALRFGLAFLRHFVCGGIPIYHVMDTLRRDHWPLGLVYCVYCYPGVSVEPGRDYGWPVGPEGTGVNYSNDVV